MAEFNVTNTLCNPTQFQVKWNYGRGIILVIEPDGQLGLSVEMMDDFVPTKPGYEAIKSLMDQYGIFLLDPSRPYEHQAIEALTACVKVNRSIYNDCKNNMRRRASAQGAYDEKSFAETLEQMGYADLNRRVDALESRLEMYKSRVEAEKVVHEKYDPEKTLMCEDPPKVFASKIAMEIWLEEHPESKAKHEAWLGAEKKAKENAAS